MMVGDGMIAEPVFPTLLLSNFTSMMM
jgi:hypothetical protein